MRQAEALGGRAVGKTGSGPLPARRGLSSEGGPALAGFQGLGLVFMSDLDNGGFMTTY